MPDLQPYYQNDLVTLYKGDCLEIMPKLNITFDACITDPPYGTTACKWDSVIPFEPMWDNLKRLVKSNGAICLFGSEPFSSALRMSNIKMFKYDWIYKKIKSSGFLNAKKIPLKNHEIISVFYKNFPNYFPQKQQAIKQRKNPSKTNAHSKQDNCYRIMDYSHTWIDDGTRLPTSIIENKYDKECFNTQSQHKMGQYHPTQKPVPLIEYLIKTYTNENDIVLDFTCGSGTTGVAAMNTNRRCVLIEQEEKYCDITVKRLQDTEKQIAERLF